jgi:hypothetical protein
MFQAGAPNYAKGASTLIPAGFPPPPAGATLCGEDVKLRTVYFIIPDDSGVQKHYASALEAAGWKVDSPVKEVAGPLCDSNQQLVKDNLTAGVFVFGSGAFTVTIF